MKLFDDILSGGAIEQDLSTLAQQLVDLVKSIQTSPQTDPEFAQTHGIGKTEAEKYAQQLSEQVLVLMRGTIQSSRDSLGSAIGNNINLYGQLEILAGSKRNKNGSSTIISEISRMREDAGRSIGGLENFITSLRETNNQTHDALNALDFKLKNMNASYLALNNFIENFTKQIKDEGDLDVDAAKRAAEDLKNRLAELGVQRTTLSSPYAGLPPAAAPVAPPYTAPAPSGLPTGLLAAAPALIQEFTNLPGQGLPPPKPEPLPSSTLSPKPLPGAAPPPSPDKPKSQALIDAENQRQAAVSARLNRLTFEEAQKPKLSAKEQRGIDLAAASARIKQAKATLKQTPGGGYAMTEDILKKKKFNGGALSDKDYLEKYKIFKDAAEDGLDATILFINLNKEIISDDTEDYDTDEKNEASQLIVIYEETLDIWKGEVEVNTEKYNEYKLKVEVVAPPAGEEEGEEGYPPTSDPSRPSQQVGEGEEGYPPTSDPSRPYQPVGEEEEGYPPTSDPSRPYQPVGEEEEEGYPPTSDPSRPSQQVGEEEEGYSPTSDLSRPSQQVGEGEEGYSPTSDLSRPSQQVGEGEEGYSPTSDLSRPSQQVGEEGYSPTSDLSRPSQQVGEEGYSPTSDLSRPSQHVGEGEEGYSPTSDLSRPSQHVGEGEEGYSPTSDLSRPFSQQNVAVAAADAADAAAAVPVVTVADIQSMLSKNNDLQSQNLEVIKIIEDAILKQGNNGATKKDLDASLNIGLQAANATEGLSNSKGAAAGAAIDAIGSGKAEEQALKDSAIATGAVNAFLLPNLLDDKNDVVMGIVTSGATAAVKDGLDEARTKEMVYIQGKAAIAAAEEGMTDSGIIAAGKAAGEATRLGLDEESALTCAEAVSAAVSEKEGSEELKTALIKAATDMYLGGYVTGRESIIEKTQKINGEISEINADKFSVGSLVRALIELGQEHGKESEELSPEEQGQYDIVAQTVSAAASGAAEIAKSTTESSVIIDLCANIAGDSTAFGLANGQTKEEAQITGIAASKVAIKEFKEAGLLKVPVELRSGVAKAAAKAYMRSALRGDDTTKSQANSSKVADVTSVTLIAAREENPGRSTRSVEIAGEVAAATIDIDLDNGKDIDDTLKVKAKRSGLKAAQAYDQALERGVPQAFAEIIANTVGRKADNQSDHPSEADDNEVTDFTEELIAQFTKNSEESIPIQKALIERRVDIPQGKDKETKLLLDKAVKSAFVKYDKLGKSKLDVVLKAVTDGIIAAKSSGKSDDEAAKIAEAAAEIADKFLADKTKHLINRCFVAEQAAFATISSMLKSNGEDLEQNKEKGIAEGEKLGKELLKEMEQPGKSQKILPTPPSSLKPTRSTRINRAKITTATTQPAPSSTPTSASSSTTPTSPSTSSPTTSTSPSPSTHSPSTSSPTTSTSPSPSTSSPSNAPAKKIELTPISRSIPQDELKEEFIKIIDILKNPENLSSKTDDDYIKLVIRLNDIFKILNSNQDFIGILIENKDILYPLLDTTNVNKFLLLTKIDEKTTHFFHDDEENEEEYIDDDDKKDLTNIESLISDDTLKDDELITQNVNSINEILKSKVGNNNYIPDKKTLKSLKKIGGTYDKYILAIGEKIAETADPEGKNILQKKIDRIKSSKRKLQRLIFRKFENSLREKEASQKIAVDSDINSMNSILGQEGIVELTTLTDKIDKFSGMHSNNFRIVSKYLKDIELIPVETDQLKQIQKLKNDYIPNFKIFLKKGNEILEILKKIHLKIMAENTTDHAKVIANKPKLDACESGIKKIGETNSLIALGEEQFLNRYNTKLSVIKLHIQYSKERESLEKKTDEIGSNENWKAASQKDSDFVLEIKNNIVLDVQKYIVINESLNLICETLRIYNEDPYELSAEETFNTKNNKYIAYVKIFNTLDNIINNILLRPIIYKISSFDKDEFIKFFTQKTVVRANEIQGVKISNIGKNLISFMYIDISDFIGEGIKENNNTIQYKIASKYNDDITRDTQIYHSISSQSEFCIDICHTRKKMINIKKFFDIIKREIQSFIIPYDSIEGRNSIRREFQSQIDQFPYFASFLNLFTSFILNLSTNLLKEVVKQIAIIESPKNKAAFSNILDEYIKTLSIDNIITYIKIRNLDIPKVEQFDYNRRFNVNVNYDNTIENERCTALKILYNDDPFKYYDERNGRYVVSSKLIDRLDAIKNLISMAQSADPKKIFKKISKMQNSNEKAEYIKQYRSADKRLLKFTVTPEENLKILEASYDHDYLFGKFTKVFLPSQKNKNIADNMTEIFDQLLLGKIVFLLGYGASGAGKTTTLVYLNKIGIPEENKDGVMIHLCNKLAGERGYNKMNVISKEFYLSKVDLNKPEELDRVLPLKSPIEGEIEFIFDKKYGFILDKKPYVHKNFHKYRSKFIKDDKGLDTTKENKSPDKKDFAVGTKLGDILIHLIDVDRLVKATSNNPNSSRSHTMIIIRFTKDSPAEGEPPELKLIVGDFAGVENKFQCDDPNTLYTFLTVKRVDTEKSFYSTEPWGDDPDPTKGGGPDKSCDEYVKSEIQPFNFSTMQLRESDLSDLTNSSEIKNIPPSTLRNYFDIICNGITLVSLDESIEKLTPDQISLKFNENSKSFIDNMKSLLTYKNLFSTQEGINSFITTKLQDNKGSNLRSIGMQKYLDDKLIEINEQFNTYGLSKKLGSFSGGVSSINTKQKIEYYKKFFNDVDAYNEQFLGENYILTSDANTKIKSNFSGFEGLIKQNKDTAIGKSSNFINSPAIKALKTFFNEIKITEDNFLAINSKLGNNMKEDMLKVIYESVQKRYSDLLTKVKEEKEKFILAIKSGNLDKINLPKYDISGVFPESTSETLNSNDLDNIIQSYLQDVTTIFYLLYGVDLRALSGIKLLNSIKKEFDNIESEEFNKKISHITTLVNILRSILRENACRVKNISSICVRRKDEGVFINDSLKKMRDIIQQTLIAKNANKIRISPNYTDACMEMYCKTDYPDNERTCFKLPNQSKKIPESVIFKEVIKTFYLNENDDEYERLKKENGEQFIEKYKTMYKDLVMAIFCVFNISKNANNPPPIPYIDTNKIKDMFYNTDVLKYTDNTFELECIEIINKMKSFESYENFTLSELCKSSVFVDFEKHFNNHTTESPYTLSRKSPEAATYFSLKEKIENFLEAVDNSNAASAIGTLEYVDRVSKFNTVNVICKPSLLSPISIYKFNETNFIDVLKAVKNYASQNRGGGGSNMYNKKFKKLVNILEKVSNLSIIPPLKNLKNKMEKNSKEYNDLDAVIQKIKFNHSEEKKFKTIINKLQYSQDLSIIPRLEYIKNNSAKKTDIDNLIQTLKNK